MLVRSEFLTLAKKGFIVDLRIHPTDDGRGYLLSCTQEDGTQDYYHSDKKRIRKFASVDAITKLMETAGLEEAKISLKPIAVTQEELPI